MISAQYDICSILGNEMSVSRRADGKMEEKMGLGEGWGGRAGAWPGVERLVDKVLIVLRSGREIEGTLKVFEVVCVRDHDDAASEGKTQYLALNRTGTLKSLPEKIGESSIR